MTDHQGVADGELPKLKKLASDLLAVESPDPAVLDEIASLAAAVAARFREHARRDLLRVVVEAAQAIFPNASEDLRALLGQATHPELSSLGALLEDADQARTAFAHADSGLMEARGRGEYGAIVPLALEAESRKKAFAAATAEFASRMGFDASLLPDIAAMSAPEATDADDATANPPPSPDELPPAPPDAAEPEADAEAAGSPVEPDMLEETPAGRRRIRDLIRQVRSTPDEAPAAR